MRSRTTSESSIRRNSGLSCEQGIKGKSKPSHARTEPDLGAAQQKKVARWVWQAIMMPHRTTESLVRLRKLEELFLDLIADLLAASHQGTELSPSPSQVYRGYSETDLSVFGLFHSPPAVPQPTDGFVTDFLGGTEHERVSLGYLNAADGAVLGIPIPDDGYHAEGIEWIGLLKSVAAPAEIHSD